MLAVLVHAGAGPLSRELQRARHDCESALQATVDRARQALEHSESALDAAIAAVSYMESEVDFFNAGRGAALCADGSIELSAAVMRGGDRALGAVAGVGHVRSPIGAARTVLEHSPHVLLIGGAAERHALAHGAAHAQPADFITERQQHALAQAGAEADRGTVGAVCLDRHGELAAATSTGGMRGQIPGRVGDTPIAGAGTWADRRVAISCTGHGEAFIRSGAARHIATLLQTGVPLGQAVQEALDQVAAIGGEGGLIALGADGEDFAAFNSQAMPWAAWREGESPRVFALP